MKSDAATSGALRFLPILGGIILIVVFLYYAFWAINSLGLENRSAFATVTGKEYLAPGTSYQSQQIAGRNYVRSLQTAERYIVTFNFLNQPAAGAVDSALYNALKSGDQVQVTYQRGRLTGAVLVKKVVAIQQGESF
jgi:hypothetical protein